MTPAINLLPLTTTPGKYLSLVTTTLVIWNNMNKVPSLKIFHFKNLRWLTWYWQALIQHSSNRHNQNCVFFILCTVAYEVLSLCMWGNSVEIVITLFCRFRCVCFHLQRCYKQIWQKSPLSSAGGSGGWGGGWWLGGDWAGQRLEPEQRTVSRLSVSAHLPPSAHP